MVFVAKVSRPPAREPALNQPAIATLLCAPSQELPSSIKPSYISPRKSSMKKTTLALIGLTYSISLPAFATETRCSEQEQTVFSCSLGKKIVSVCAAKDISPTNGYVQYRFGPKNAPELIFPTSTESTNRSFMRSGNKNFQDLVPKQELGY